MEREKTLKSVQWRRRGRRDTLHLVQKAIVVRGRWVGRQRIDLDEPVADVSGEVEVVVRAAPTHVGTGKRDVFQIIASLGIGTRSKSEIDRQLVEDRAGWPDR